MHNFLNSLLDQIIQLRSIQYHSAQKVHMAWSLSPGNCRQASHRSIWRCIESARSVLDMNPTLKTLCDACQECSCDAPSLLLYMVKKIFSYTAIHDDALFASIFQSPQWWCELQDSKCSWTCPEISSTWLAGKRSASRWHLTWSKKWVAVVNKSCPYF